MARKRKFGDGGEIREGQNENIGDDTRARALAWLKSMQEGGGEAAARPERQAGRPAPRASRVAATDTGDEMARMLSRAPRAAARAAVEDREIPTNPTISSPKGDTGGPSLGTRLRNAIFPGGTQMPGNSALDSLNALAPGVAGAAGRGAGRILGAGASGLKAGRAEAAQAAKYAEEAAANYKKMTPAAKRIADRAKLAPAEKTRAEDWTRIEQEGERRMLEKQAKDEAAKNLSEVRAGRRWGGEGEDAADVGAGMYRKGGKVKKYAAGGSVSSASRRADGIAKKGKTKGRLL